MIIAGRSATAHRQRQTSQHKLAESQSMLISVFLLYHSSRSLSFFPKPARRLVHTGQASSELECAYRQQGHGC
jgi:hypothetical protein